MTWKCFPLYWPFVRGIHWWPVDSPNKEQVAWALMFSLMLSWTNCIVKQIIELPVIRDAIILMWCHCNTNWKWNHTSQGSMSYWIWDGHSVLGNQPLSKLMITMINDTICHHYRLQWVKSLWLCPQGMRLWFQMCQLQTRLGNGYIEYSSKHYSGMNSRRPYWW